MKVHALRSKDYTPIVMRENIPWDEVKEGLFIGINKGGESQVWCSHMTMKDLAYIKVALDTYIEDEIRE